MSMRTFAILALVAFAMPSLAMPCIGSAQRRRARPDPEPVPATLTIEHASSDMPGLDAPERFVVRVTARDAIELVADRRQIEIELTVPGRRRPVVCRSPERSARPSPARLTQLAAGAAWAEWIDLREYCWGRDREALSAAESMVLRLSVGRSRRAFVVRRGEGAGSQVWSSIASTAMPVSLAREPAPADGSAARVTLGDVDARSRRFTFRVTLRSSSGTRRVFFRPSHVSFQVRGPGGVHVCSIPGSAASPIPDLFRRVSERAGVSLALDASQYCEEVFRSAGIYEVVPIVELDASGDAWELDALTGRFEGEPALVRVPRDPRGYVERAPGGGDV